MAKVTELEKRLNKVESILTRSAHQARRPGSPNGASVEVDLQTKRDLAAEAQALGLRSGDELAQIVLHAFIEMMCEEPEIRFPLALTQAFEPA